MKIYNVILITLNILFFAYNIWKYKEFTDLESYVRWECEFILPHGRVAVFYADYLKGRTPEIEYSDTDYYRCYKSKEK